MVHGENAILPVETETPPWRMTHFNKKENKLSLKYVAYLIAELQEVALILEFATKHMTARRYNSKIKSREMRKDGLVLKEVVMPASQGKLQPNYEWLYGIYQKLPHGAYKLQEFEGSLIPII